MKNWLRNRKNRHTAFDLEDALRSERPLPPQHLVKAITARLHHRPVRIRLRLGRAVVVAAGVAALLVGSSMAAGLGPAGGLHLSSVIHTFSGPPAKHATPPASAADEYVGPPTITGFSPTSGLVGSSVAIGGTNLGGTTSVTFNGTSATSFSVSSATSITATVPAGATTGTISVTNPGGTATSAGTFTVIQTPSITSFSPTFGPVGTVVTIGGTHFTGATVVTFNATTAVSFSVDSDTQITATVPTGATTGKITVTNPAGSGVSSTNYVVAAEQTPANITFTPTSGKVGTTVNISGQHFAGVNAVLFNGQAATFNFVSDTKVTATVPAGATTGPITVSNDAGSADSVADFSVIVTPSISSFTPSFGAVGQTVTVNGSGFTGTTAVKIGTGTASFSFVSDTQLTVTVTAASKTGPITVTNPAGSDVSADTFTVVTTPPKITTFAPAFGVLGDHVVITGTNLSNTTDVKFGSVSAAFVVNSGTQVTATVPTVPPVAGGTMVKITVVTDVGPATSTATFQVIEPPVITSFTPGSGKAGTTTVTINGSGFFKTTAVTFLGGAGAGDDVSASPITVAGDTKITVKVPVGAVSGPIEVDNAAGTDTSIGSFVVSTAAPTISSFAPSHGPSSAQAQTTVTIDGTDLRGVTGVTLNGKPMTSVSVASDTEITAVTPAGGTSGLIKVTTPAGSVDTAHCTGLGCSPSTFTVDGAPKVTSLSTPVAGFTFQGQTVAINGSNLASVTQVQFGTAAPVAVASASATQVTVVVPAVPAPGSGPTVVNVTVINSNGETATSSSSLTVVQSPSITSFTPGSGKAGTTMVTILGSHFTGTGKFPATDKVVFVGTNDGGVDDQTASPITVVGDTKITVKVPVGAVSGPIEVVNAAGNDTSAGNFVVSIAAPTITSFAPSDGPDSSVFQSSVTIDGTNLDSVTSVTFNNKPATLVSVMSPTQLLVTAPVGATSGLIKVTTPAGSVDTAHCTGLGCSPSTFTVDPGPVITSFDSSGTVGGNATITGTGFLTRFNTAIIDNATTLTLNGVDITADISGISCPTAPLQDCQSSTISSTTVLTFTVPSGATTGTLTIANNYGESATTSSVFTVNQPPSIASFSPTSGAVGDEVTITGQHFSGATEVDFNGVQQTTVTVDSDSQIRADVPAGATSGVISVTTAIGTGTSVASFTVTP